MPDDAEKLAGVLKRMPMGQVLPADSQIGPTLFLALRRRALDHGFTIRVDGDFNST